MLMDSGQDCVLIIQYSNSMLLLIRAIPCRSLPELHNKLFNADLMLIKIKLIRADGSKEQVWAEPRPGAADRTKVCSLNV